MFTRVNDKGEVIRNAVVIDCQAKIESGEEVILTEQNHKGTVDINEIVKSRGVDRIAESMNIQAMTFDENPYNNFQEMMEMVARGREAFESLPAETRKEFRNDAAAYLDYVRNPDNKDAMIERGWLAPDPVAPPPVQVEVVAQPTTETPPEGT